MTPITEHLSASRVQSSLYRLSQRGTSHFAVGIFLAALVVRLLAALAMRHFSAPPGHEFNDAIDYNEIAINLAMGRGYMLAGLPTSFRAPGLPLFLAAVYKVFGVHYQPVYLALALLGALSCVLVYFVSRFVVEEKIAKLAAIASVLYLPHVYSGTLLESEPLFIALHGACLYFFLVYLDRGQARSLIAGSIALALAVLTRPFALLEVALVLIVFVRPGAWSRRLMVCAAALLSFALVLAPWMYRNYKLYGRSAPITTVGGGTFYGSNNDVVLNEPRYRGGWISSLHLPFRAKVDAGPDEVARDQVEWQLGREWVRSHVSSLPKLLVFKLARFSLPDIASENRKYVLMQGLGTTPYLIGIFIGILICLGDRKYWSTGWIILHGTAAVSVAIALVFWGSPRFRDANLQVLMLYFALGAWRISEWYSIRVHRGRSLT